MARHVRPLLVLLVCSGLLCHALIVTVFAAPAHAVDDDASSVAWMRPVDGRVVEPFRAPAAVFGAGHRGADLAPRIEVLRERITKKKSPAEKQISRAYVEEVVRAYEHFFFRYSASNLLVINTSEIDFVDRNADLQQLLSRLQEPVKGTQYFLPLGDSGAH